MNIIEVLVELYPAACGGNFSQSRDLESSGSLPEGAPQFALVFIFVIKDHFFLMTTIFGIISPKIPVRDAFWNNGNRNIDD